MNILVIGGNSFFGKKLVKNLIDEGEEVTLLNRGNKDDGFGDKVNRLKCDRTDQEALVKIIGNMNFDVIYDQVCFDYKTAKAACEVFEGKVGHYIFTSSMSVYGPGVDMKEEVFDPSKHSISEHVDSQTNYGEAKRQAEVGFDEYAKFSCTFVRFPIVIGSDDVTRRIHFHIENIKNKRAIKLPNLEAKMSFISSDFAAKSLAKLKSLPAQGPLNIASNKPMSLKRLMEIIENETDGELIVDENGEQSPYGIKKDWYMDVGKLNELGLKGEEFENWFPGVVKEILKKERA